VCANPATLDASQRAALAAWLHPAHWPAGLGGQRALGMLAQWQHWPAPATAPRPALPPRLRLVTYKLATHIRLAEQVCARLAAAGCQVEQRVLDFPEFAANHWRHNADLMLTGEVLNDDLDYSCHQWLAGESGFHPWLPEPTRHALQIWVGRSQAEPDSATRWQHYAAAASLLVREHALIPLQHSTMRLEFDPQLRGIALTQCGWMDFRQLWFDSAA
jgi:SgrR family transcriptional regulator